MKHRKLLDTLRLGAGLLALATAATAQTQTTFETGAGGWSGPTGPGGATSVEASGGNSGANMRTVFNDFGITFRNSDPGFVFDYTQPASLTIGIDTLVHDIRFFGSPVPRPWLVELRDFDNPPGGFPWVSVWFKFADISAAQHGSWTRFEVTIDDTSATALPPGWGGYGAEDGLGNPMLPPGRTFASVLAGVDQVAFTTLEPGFFFGFTDFDVRIDNVSVETGAMQLLQYCTGKTNSQGCVPFLAFDGVPSATSTSPFVVAAEDLVAAEAGFLLYGFKKSNLNFHGGKLCIKAPITRWLPAKFAKNVGLAPCVGRIARNFNARIQSGADPALSTGQLVYVQLRQRDPALADGFNDTLTDGLRFAITP